MPIELKMPALSPTMEEGTLAKWLVKQGDVVKSGDILAEIETDKATMEYEAVDEGTIAQIVVPEGQEGVRVGAVIALLAEDGEDASQPAPAPEQDHAEGEKKQTANGSSPPSEAKAAPMPERDVKTSSAGKPGPHDENSANGRIKASPLARRLAEQQGLDLATVSGSGPNGRIVKADLAKSLQAEQQAEQTVAQAPTQERPPQPESSPAPAEKPASPSSTIPHEAVKLSSMRRTIARRLTESKQTVPHIYLTVDVNLDRLLDLRSDLNDGLSARGLKLSVNDLLIKALALALEAVPKCNVQYAGDELLMFKRADISVAVSIPNGLITPIVADAGAKTMSRIATEMKDLAVRAKEGKLQPEEYQGGTASLSNMGMFGIRQFEAVINPPQGMIMAIGAGEKRAIVIDDGLAVATMMSATGSFDHRAIDGADGAQLMKAFRELIESPLAMLA